MELPNQTRADAIERVFSGRSSCLANKPSLEYLLALREYLLDWQLVIDAELYRVQMCESQKE